jgi:hypothetical protein
VPVCNSLKFQERGRTKGKLSVSNLNKDERFWEIVWGEIYWLGRLDMKEIIAEVII